MNLSKLATDALTKAILSDEEAKNAIFAQAVQGVMKLEDYKVKESLEQAARTAVYEVAKERAKEYLALPEVQEKIRISIEESVRRCVASIVERAPDLVQEVFSKASRY